MICVGLAALFVARYLLAPLPVEAPFEGGMPLAAILTRFTAAHPQLAAAIATVIVVWTLLVIVQLTVKYAPAASRNYLPAQIFLVVAGGLVVPGEALAAIFVSLLSALAARQLVFSFHKGYSFRELFHAGFYLGFIPLLYAPAAAIVLPIAVAALWIYRRSAREAVVCLAGLLLPVAGAGFIHWAAGADGGFILRELLRCALERNTEWNEVPLPLAAAGTLPFVLSFIAIFQALTHKKSLRKTQYKFMQHTSLTLLLLVASAAVPGTSTTLLALAALPLALSVPYAFTGKAATVSTLVYCFIIVAVLVLDLLPVLDFQAH